MGMGKDALSKGTGGVSAHCPCIWVTEGTLEITLQDAFGSPEAAESTPLPPTRLCLCMWPGNPRGLADLGALCRIRAPVSHVDLWHLLVFQQIPLGFIAKSPSLEPSFPGLPGLGQVFTRRALRAFTPLTSLPRLDLREQGSAGWPQTHPHVFRKRCTWTKRVQAVLSSVNPDDRWERCP